MGDEITRINLIISQLLDFSRPSTGKRHPVHVHDLILDTVKMLKPQPIMEGMEITLNLNARLDLVFADANQMQQVFLNIVMNAADVLADRGYLEAKTPNILTVESRNPNDFIEIKFTDTGPGIPQEELIQVFDPFYTTKEPGKGDRPGTQCLLQNRGVSRGGDQRRKRHRKGHDHYC